MPMAKLRNDQACAVSLGCHLASAELQGLGGKDRAGEGVHPLLKHCGDLVVGVGREGHQAGLAATSL